jgi:hypothetical protein
VTVHALIWGDLFTERYGGAGTFQAGVHVYSTLIRVGTCAEERRISLYGRMVTPERCKFKQGRNRGCSELFLSSALDFLARLAALVPPPRAHLIRYHGVFAPNSR